MWSDIWNVSYYIELQILKPSKLWSSQLWTQFKQLRIEAWKSQDFFKRVWSRDLMIPVRHSNQLSYEATDVGSWSAVSSNEPVKNGCEVIFEMFHILYCGFRNQVSYDHRNCKKPRWSPDFFMLLYAIAWIAFITAMIMAYLISNPQFNISLHIHSSRAH